MFHRVDNSLTSKEGARIQGTPRHGTRTDDSSAVKDSKLSCKVPQSNGLLRSHGLSTAYAWSGSSVSHMDPRTIAWSQPFSSRFWLGTFMLHPRKASRTQYLIIECGEPRLTDNCVLGVAKQWYCYTSHIRSMQVLCTTTQERVRIVWVELPQGLVVVPLPRLVQL